MWARTPLVKWTIGGGAGIGFGVVAAVAEVFGAVLVAFFHGADEPVRRGVGVHADGVDEVGTVAEEHGAFAAEMGVYAGEGADAAFFDDGQGLAPEGIPAAAVVNANRGAVFFDGGQHAVGVGEGGGQGFFAEDGGDAGLGSVDDHLGVEVV